MHPSIEQSKDRLRELRDQVVTCGDPFNLLAEFAYENEKLRKQIAQLKSEQCSCI